MCKTELGLDLETYRQVFYHHGTWDSSLLQDHACSPVLPTPHHHDNQHPPPTTLCKVSQGQFALSEHQLQEATHTGHTFQLPAWPLLCSLGLPHPSLQTPFELG